MIKQGRGQTLLEILLAFGASILVLSAVVLGVTTSLSNTQYTKKQGLANSYAREGMAVVRKIKDLSWTVFSSKSGSFCIGPDLEPGLTYSADDLKTYSGIFKCSGFPVGGIFAREVKFEHNSPDCSDGKPEPNLKGSKVTVKVSWPDSKCPAGEYCHNVKLITCFANIDTKPTP